MFVMLAIGKKRFFLLNCAPSYLVSEYFQWLPKIATVGARVFTDTHSYRRRSHGQHGHCPCEAPSFEKARLLTHFLWATGSHGQLAKREELSNGWRASFFNTAAAISIHVDCAAAAEDNPATASAI